MIQTTSKQYHQSLTKTKILEISVSNDLKNKASVVLDRNGRNSHVNMQTQHKSESSKHYLDVNSIFDGKKFEPPNDSTKRLHKSISRKEMPNSRQDNERIPFPPTNCSRRSTHKAKNTFG